MSKSKHVKTDITRYALGGVILVSFVGGLFGVFGQTVQSLGLSVTILFPVLISVCLAIRASVWLLNRTCRYCRKALLESSDNDASVCGIDPKTDRLESTVESMRREEASCVKRYSLRRCSAEDVIRAKALRVQAEIKLIRHETMPKSWAEVCGEDYSSKCSAT